MEALGSWTKGLSPLTPGVLGGSGGQMPQGVWEPAPHPTHSTNAAETCMAKMDRHMKSLLSLIILSAAATAAKSLQLCLTLCDPIDGSPPGSLVPVILQARTLEWVAVSFPNA